MALRKPSEFFERNIEPKNELEFRIGNNYGSELFTGNISSLKVYDYSRTDQEVTQDYDAIKGRYGL